MKIIYHFHLLTWMDIKAIILDDSGREFNSPCSKIGDMTPADDKQNLQIFVELKPASDLFSISSLGTCILKYIIWFLILN